MDGGPVAGGQPPQGPVGGGPVREGALAAPARSSADRVAAPSLARSHRSAGRGERPAPVVLQERGGGRARSPAERGESLARSQRSGGRRNDSRSRSRRDRARRDRSPDDRDAQRQVAADDRGPRAREVFPGDREPQGEEFALRFQPGRLDEALQSWSNSERIKDKERRCDQCSNAATQQYAFTPVVMCRSCWQVLRRVDHAMYEEFGTLNSAFNNRMAWDVA